MSPPPGEPCWKEQGYVAQQGALDAQQLLFSTVRVINGHNPSRQGLEEMRLQKCTVRTWEQLSWLLTGLRSLNKRVWKEEKKKPL